MQGKVIFKQLMEVLFALKSKSISIKTRYTTDKSTEGSVVINDIKRVVKNGLRLPLQLLRRYFAKSGLTQLELHPDPILKAIGMALKESLSNDLSIPEQEAICLIENRRNQLYKSKKEIVIKDYGAGSPNANRTKEDMDRGGQSKATLSSITFASKPKFWAVILFKLIRKLKPESCLELGSCVGISASYQASALNLNGQGSIVTMEGSPDIATIAQQTFDLLHLKNASVAVGSFQKNFIKVLEESKPIDFFFNDGHHDHDAVLLYFNQILPYLSENAVIVFDDISWSKGMKKAWREIEDDKRVFASIDLHTIGIVLVSRSFTEKVKFKIPL